MNLRKYIRTTLILKKKLQTNIRMNEKKHKQKYKILYISTLIDDKTDHKEIQYIIKRSKIGLTLKQVLRRKRLTSREALLNRVMNMKPFENASHE